MDIQVGERYDIFASRLPKLPAEVMNVEVVLCHGPIFHRDIDSGDRSCLSYRTREGGVIASCKVERFIEMIKRADELAR